APGGGGHGRTPMALPVGQPTLFHSEVLRAEGFDARGACAMLPVGDLDGIYVNTGRELAAVDPLRGSLAWVSLSPVRDAAPAGYRASDRGDENINDSHVLAAACGGDVVVAALQVPDRGNNVDFHGGLRIVHRLPLRRLYAFSRSSGKLLWSHFDELDGPRTRRFGGHDACGPPLVLGDTVYAPVHDRSGAIAFSIGAYDLRTGAPKWRRLVCSSQQEVNMFGNARLEFAASPLAAADGLLFGAANLGVVFALELATGRIRWITAHEVVRMPMTRFYNQQDRVVYFANNPPVVAAGVACFTPVDSAFVLGVDVETGRLAWRVPADAPVGGIEHNVRWLAGCLDDEFVLAGRGAVAVRARPRTAGGDAEVRSLVPPELLRDRTEGRLPGRPAMTADHVWLSVGRAILGFDRAGNPASELPPLRAPRLQPGNLLFVDGIVVSLRQGALDVLADPQALAARVAERVQQAPDDPAAILRLCAVRAALLPAGAPASAREGLQDLYRRGLAAAERAGLPLTHPVRQALQRELFDQALAAAAAALAARDPRAVELLVAARGAAPVPRDWVRVQILLLDQLGADPGRRRAELERLAAEAPTGEVELPAGRTLPVRAYVLWQTAQLPDEPPAAAVAHWQQLIEQHAGALLDGGDAATVAAQAIAALLARHGPEVYAAVAARADAALLAAGDDPDLLQSVGAAFPTSAAAVAARARLLDLAVRRGDLAVAGAVFAQALRAGELPPGLLRRLAVAATGAGNRGLARAAAARLAAHGAVASDWPEDRGLTYAEVLASLAPGLERPAAVPVPAVPVREIARIPPHAPPDPGRLVPTVLAEDFDVPADAPLFVVAGA
ncbi:MAG: hypothetical protein FJ265_20965, partial [Planctomycetes bacterium]|nr:hypothetical protein [Planctomycetota bacterium]